MKICLSMIVKNEAHCIARCLESVKPYIDYWVICDTGSTDNTGNIIKETLKNIPGEFHKNEWVDFSTNRNIALDLAKPKGDYILFIDADDTFIVEDKQSLKQLNEPVYSILFLHGNITYPRAALISSKISSSYVGVLHEVIIFPKNIIPKPLNGCFIKFGADGNRSKNPQKFVHDAEVLEKAIQKDPSNARYYFYCAQSYKDAATMNKINNNNNNNNNITKTNEYLSKAAHFYRQRTLITNGWIEEQAYAALELGKILEEIRPKDITEILNYYILSYNLTPFKVEPLVAACKLLRKNKLYQLSYFYAKIGLKINEPSYGLFIHPESYSWLIKDELAVAAFYVGSFKEAYDLNKQILNTVALPANDRTRIHKNMTLCQERLY